MNSGAEVSGHFVDSISTFRHPVSETATTRFFKALPWDRKDEEA